MIVVVDAGIGNVASVSNMLVRLGYQSSIRRVPDGLTNEDRFIVPGVGSYDAGVTRLKSSGWFEFIRDLPPSTPVLGICLGMQLLGEGSEEGRLLGIGRVPAQFVRFPDERLPVPHMGWNTLVEIQDDTLFDTALGELRYYFTHSYFARCTTPGDIAATTHYGFDFTSAYRRGNTFGVQFHPEKSHKFGMSLLSRFAEL